MKKPIYEIVMERLAERKGQWSLVAAGSGVPKRTLEKIARAEIRNPGIKHIQRLADYFERVAAKGSKQKRGAS